MRNKYNYLMTLIIIIMMVLLYSCSAVQYTGDIIRSGQKDFEAVYVPGITKADILALNNPVIAVNGISPTGQVIIGYIPGSTSANVYTDMFILELMKKGIVMTTLAQGTEDVMKNQKFQLLDSLGNQMVLIVNTNLASSSSVTEFTTGGEYAKVGITSFTVKGIRTSDNKVLFIGSGTYGKAKDAAYVAKDLSFLVENIFKGTLKKLEDPD